MLTMRRLQWIVLGLVVVSLVGVDLQPHQQHRQQFRPHPNGIRNQAPQLKQIQQRPLNRSPNVNQLIRPKNHQRNGYGSNDPRCALTIPPGPNGDVPCVTYESVDRAFLAAQQKMNFPRPKGRSMTDIDVDHLGQILVETSRNLALEYNLHVDAVHNGLPLIDTQRTVIDKFCPAYLKRPKCTIKRYREYNGMCNNLDHPHWGATLAPYRRLLPADYADGVSEPRISKTGKELPTARYVSAYNHHDYGYHDHAVTMYLPAWGQLMDHDMTQGAESKEVETDSEPKCCDRPPEQRHPACWPIEIPSQDPFYSLFSRRCMEFVRSASGLQEYCKLGPRNTMNVITSTLDANFIYGASKDTADKLRTFNGGLLKSNPVHRHIGLKDLLPPKLESPDAGCVRPDNNSYCFLAGDSRSNQQMMLITHHTIMMREHNRIATELGYINPHWDDEKIYQETRHIMAAIVQHITYNEFLPMVLGKDIMSRYGLLLQKDGMGSFYDPTVNPTVSVAFFAAAYRFGHSLIPSSIERWSVSHQYVGARRLSEMLLKPFDVYGPGTCDQYLAGFMNQVSQAVDDSISEELTNHLFAEGQNRWGMDLASLNMQRGRDHGLPSYNAYRQYCGLGRARHWDDLAGVFTNQTLQRYVEIYATPDDIDLWSAGISERPSPGSMVGPVFGCIIGETFRNLRYGDRFWYENSGWPSSFTLAQLNEIRKVKLSRIVCDNADHIESAQIYVMVLPDPQVNPRIPCRSSVLPRIDLGLWRDIDNQHAPYNDGPNDGHLHSYETEQLFQVPPAFQHLQNDVLSFDEPPYPTDPNSHLQTDYPPHPPHPQENHPPHPQENHPPHPQENHPPHPQENHPPHPQENHPPHPQHPPANHGPPNHGHLNQGPPNHGPPHPHPPPPPPPPPQRPHPHPHPHPNPGPAHHYGPPPAQHYDPEPEPEPYRPQHRPHTYPAPQRYKHLHRHKANFIGKLLSLG